MKVIIIAICVTIIVVSVVLLIRDFFVRSKVNKLAWKKYLILKPLLEKLALNQRIEDYELISLAESPSMRLPLYRALKGYQCVHLFPDAFYTEEKGAEGHMVNWLEFPTELGTEPDEISLMTIVTPPDDLQAHYYVFKFRMLRSHWAKKLSWVTGVCGPYHDKSSPFDEPGRIFSRFNPVEAVNPESEVQWVLQHINPFINDQPAVSVRH